MVFSNQCMWSNIYGHLEFSFISVQDVFPVLQFYCHKTFISKLCTFLIVLTAYLTSKMHGKGDFEKLNFTHALAVHSILEDFEKNKKEKFVQLSSSNSSPGIFLSVLTKIHEEVSDQITEVTKQNSIETQTRVGISSSGHVVGLRSGVEFHMDIHYKQCLNLRW